MKVICIDNSGYSRLGTLKASDFLKEGETYTVVRELEDRDAYIIAEVDHPDGCRKYRFIPLSQIDETEMERNYNLQSV